MMNALMIKPEDQELVDKVKAACVKHDNIVCEYDFERANIEVVQAIPLVFYVTTPKGTAYVRVFVSTHFINDAEAMGAYLVHRVLEDVKRLMESKN